MTEGGRTERITSAKIRVGIAISVSIARLSAWSTQPPTTAARKPSAMPIANDSSAAASATPIVREAPQSRRVRMSRPRLSVPSGNAAENGSQTSPATCDSP